MQRSRIALATGLFVTALLALRLVWQGVTPELAELRFEEESGAQREALLPLRWPTQSRTLAVTLRADVPALHPRFYDLEVRGCVEHLAVNGQEVAGPRPHCEDWLRGGDARIDSTVDLGAALHPGANTLAFRLQSGREPGDFTLHTLNLRPALRDPLVVAMTGALLFLVLVYGGYIARQLGLGWDLALPFLGGAVLRVVYAIGTSISLRAYDWHGHLVYVSYVAEQHAIPPAQHGWETYQPPLYYALCAAWVWLGSLLGWPPERLYQEDLQAFSLLLSLAALAAGLYTGTLLFPEKGQIRERLLFGGMLAALPGFVFFSSRVSNDSLFQLLAFLVLALALRFWQGGREGDWWSLAASLGLAMLTKSNALVLVPFAAAVLALAQGVAPRRKAVLGAGATLVWLALAGWLFVLRFGVEGEVSLVGNMHRFDPAFVVPNALRHFVVFDPLEVLRHPYVDDLLDASRRVYFWEYLFRTAHFGGFDLGSQGTVWALGVCLLAASLLLLPCAALGFVSDLRLRCPAAPLWLAALALLGAHVAYRLRYPYSFNQDFRFSVLLAVPISYYAVSGMARLPGFLRSAATGVALAFVALSSALVIALAFGG